MGTFAVDAIVAEIDQRLGQARTRARKPLRQKEANDGFVDLLATVELINRYATSELLTAGQPPRGRAASQSLSDDVIARLKKWVAQIQEVLRKLAQALHASSWSVTVGFPWTILISVDFKIPGKSG